MSTKPDCEQARSLAAEVALGITSGEERAGVLAHIARCAECKQLVAELSEIGDQLLLLAPEAEPPAGFESAALVRLETRRKHRPSWRAAVAGVAVAALSAGAVVVATSADRERADEYATALEEAHGTYFGAFSLRPRDGSEAGDVFVYNGARPWIFAVFSESMPPGAYRAQLITHDGERIELGYFELSPDDRDWGREVDVDLRDVRGARIISQDSGASYIATFQEH